MTFNIAPGSVSTSDCIKIQVQNPFASTTPSYYTAFTSSSVSCSFTTSPSGTTCSYIDAYTVQINFATSGSTSVVGSLSFLNNPISKTGLNITVGLYHPCTSSVAQNPIVNTLTSFVTGSLNTPTVKSSSQVVGSQGNTLTLNFTPATILPPTGIITLQVPYWIPGSTFYYVLASGRQSVVSSSTLQVSTSSIFLTPSSGYGLYTFSYSTTSGTALTSSTSITLQITNFRNPVTQNALSGFSLITSDDNYNLIDQTNSGFSFTYTGTATPNSITQSSTGAFELFLTGTTTSDFTVAQTRDLMLSFSAQLPLSTNCYVKIQFPDQIRIDIDETILGYSGTGFMATTNGNNISKSPYTSSTGSNYIIFPSCTDTTQLYQLTQTGTVTFQSVISPTEVISIGQFQIYIGTDSSFSSSTLIAQGTLTPGVTMVAGTSTLSTFVPATDQTVQAANAYNIVFSLASNLFSTSVIYITYPTNLNVSGATSFSINSATNMRNDATITISNGVMAISNAFFDVSNYGFDSSIAGMNITLQISQAYNPYSVVACGSWSLTTKNLVSGSYFTVDTGTASTSFTPTSSALTPSGSGVSVANPTTFYASSYWTFTIATVKYLNINSMVILTLPSTITIPSTSAVQCEQTNAAGVTQSASCSASSTSVTIRTSAFVSANTNLVVLIKGIENPATFKISDSMSFETADSSGNTIATGTGFFVTMTIMSQMTSIVPVLTNKTNGAMTNYNFTITSSNPFTTSDTLVLTFPAEVLLKSTGVNKCFNGGTSLSCTVSLQTLTIPKFSTTSGATKVNILVTNITNPPSERVSSSFSGIKTYFVDGSGNQYNSQQYSSNVTVQTSSPANILTYNLTQASLALNQPTQYQIIFTPTNAISATGSIVLTWPAQVVVYSNVTAIITTYKTFPNSFSIDLQTNEITFTGIFQSSYTGQITIQLDPVTNPIDTRNLNGFQIKTYDDANQLYAIDVLNDYILTPAYQCEFPCATCSLTNKTNCLSCWNNQGFNDLMSYTGGYSTCKATCDPGYTRNGNANNICSACDVSCSKCQDNGLVGDKLLCTTCASGYNYRYGSYCFQNCTGAYYQANSTNCGLCQSPCSSCVNQATNCTSCLLSSGKPYLLGTSCVSSCPSGYTLISNQCILCQAPCTSCVDSATKCTACDPGSPQKYLFGYQCYSTCPSGTSVNNVKNTCDGCESGCKICDTTDQSKCLLCDSGLYLYKSECSANCPDGYQVNFMDTACVPLQSLPLFPFPHLIACLFMSLIVMGCYFKDKRTLVITNLISFYGIVEFVCFFVQIGLCFIFATYKFAAVAFAAFFCYVLINVGFFTYFLIKIARQDPEFINWRSVHPKTFWIVSIASLLFTFKLSRLFYSKLAGFENFKATFERQRPFQILIILVTVAHIIICNGLMCVFDVAGFKTFSWGTQLYINMIESAVISIVIVVLEIVEFFFIKRYLKDDMDYYQVNHDSVMNVSEMPSNDDIRLRQETLKTLMGKVRANKDLFLNNKLDDLFDRFGHRRCNSMLGQGTQDKEEDPRLVRSEPISPSNQGFSFERGNRDNVYAEARPADPLGKLGKTFSDAELQVKPDDRILKRKGGEFVNFDTDANRLRKDRKQRKRGRKNQYYSQIDAEDDEEVERDKENGPENEDDLGVIREEGDEIEYEQRKKMKQQQKLPEKSPTKSPVKDSQTLGQTAQPSPEKIRDLEEEDTIIKEQEEAMRNSPQKTDIMETQAMEEHIDEQLRLRDDVSDIGVNRNVLIEDSLKDFNKQSLEQNKGPEAPLQGEIQVPPDAQKRNFNENDVLGEFDRDEKGNIIILQDENGMYVDKLGRPVNERGYLIKQETGDVVDSKEQRKMFDHSDVDERGELPAPFCVEKHNFNPFCIRGHFNLDKKGQEVIPQPNKNKELVDKTGRRVNKGGWLVDKQGNIVDHTGMKKFDKKQLVNDDLPKLFNYSGRRFDIMEVCGSFDRDENGNPVLKSPKKQSSKAPNQAQTGRQDNKGRLVNERGYLVDASGNIVNKEGKKIFDFKHLKNGEFPKIFPFTKFNIKNIQGNFEMDPLGNPILDKAPLGPGFFLDRDGKLVNQRGYLINERGEVIDKKGKIMFTKETLDEEGEIPKVFRTGLLKSDTASSLSRLMSEIEKNQPFEEGNSERMIQNELAKMQQQNRKTPQQTKNAKVAPQQQIERNDSEATSMNSMMGDTPSNYNLANQRFDADRSKSQPRGGQDYRLPTKQPGHIDEEMDSELGSDQNRMGTLGSEQKRNRKKPPNYQYKDPSDKDIKMAKAYGGVARGNKQRIMPKANNSNRMLTASSNDKKRQRGLQNVAEQVVGYSQMDHQKSGERLDDVKMQRFMQPDQHMVSGTIGHQALQQYTNEPSIQAVPEHHIREQRLKQKKMAEAKKREKMKRKGGGLMDADFEKMFGKDIDEFLEDSDWDIESFGKMSNFSKGTARSALADGRIRGLESIYLQRIETSMKKPITKNTTKHKKQPAAFRVMQDRFMDDLDMYKEESKRDLQSVISKGNFYNQNQSRVLESANSTTNMRAETVFQKGKKGGQFNNTEYREGANFTSNRFNL